MKNFTLFLIISTLLFISCNSKTEYDSAENYNNDIISMQEKLYIAIDSLEMLMNADELNEESINLAYENAKKVSEDVLDEIDNIIPFEDDDKFYKTAENLFSTFDNLLKNEYASLINYLNKPIEEWSDADFGNFYDTWDKLEDDIINKENEFFDAQEKFVENNNLEM